MLFRVLATLAFTVSLDILFFGYTAAVQQIFGYFATFLGEFFEAISSRFVL